MGLKKASASRSFSAGDNNPESLCGRTGKEDCREALCKLQGRNSKRRLAKRYTRLRKLRSTQHVQLTYDILPNRTQTNNGGQATVNER